MNEATLLGTLRSDPELKQIDGFDGQVALCKAFLGISDRNDVESMMEVMAWGGKGEELARSCRNGQQVVFTGSLQIEARLLPSGVKNKVAQLIVSSFVAVSGGIPPIPAKVPTSGKVINANFGNNNRDNEPDLDDIPF